MPYETAAQSEISVIIVNYATAALAVEAVESVLSHGHSGHDVDVHVLDNASPGDDADLLRLAHTAGGWGTRVTLHLETINHGFGRGNNLVLRRLSEKPASPRLVFFLNPDAQLANEALAELADFLDAHPDAAIAGCAIQRPDCDELVTAAFRFPNLVGEFTSALGLGVVERPLRQFSTALKTSLPRSEVDWVSGAAFMARFDALAAVDFFDPSYFLYFEETDLMRRVRKASWSIHYVPTARVVHVAGAATGQHSRRTKRLPKPPYWYESWRLYFTRNHGRAYALLTMSGKLLGWSMNGLLRALQRRRPDSPKGFARDALSYVIVPLLLPTKLHKHR